MITKWMWSDMLKCVVEVKGQGHFPDTFVVKTPEGLITEVYASTLKSNEQIRKDETQAKAL